MKRIRCANCGVEASVGPRARLLCRPCYAASVQSQRLASEAERDALLTEAQRREHLPEVPGAAAGTVAGRYAGGRPQPPSPTATRGGTAERVAVYAARVRSGLALGHPEDYQPDE